MVKHPYSPKTLYSNSGSSSRDQREEGKVGIVCQPVHPEEIKSPAPGERCTTGGKTQSPATALPAQTMNGSLKKFNCGSQGWPVRNPCQPTLEWKDGSCPQLSKALTPMQRKGKKCFFLMKEMESSLSFRIKTPFFCCFFVFDDQEENSAFLGKG